MIGEEFNEISSQVGGFGSSDRTEKDNVINVLLGIATRACSETYNIFSKRTEV